MATFRIHRMKDSTRQLFRWAPHTSGVTQIKPKDFEAGEELECAGFYDAWTQMKNRDRPLEVGDLLEAANGDLRICKYVGFEQAQWILPEVRADLESAPLAVGGTVSA